MNGKYRSTIGVAVVLLGGLLCGNSVAAQDAPDAPLVDQLKKGNQSYENGHRLNWNFGDRRRCGAGAEEGRRLRRSAVHRGNCGAIDI